MSLKTTVENYKKAKSVFQEIDDMWYDVETGEMEASEFRTNQMLNRLKDLKRHLRYVDVSDLKGNYPEKTINSVTDNFKTFQEALYFWERQFLAAKYAADLLDPLRLKYIPELRLSDKEREKFGNNTNIAKAFISVITNQDNVKEYENKIKRMILGTMSQSEFRKIFDVLQHKMIPTKGILSKHKQKAKERGEEFNVEIPESMNEDFFNPFDEIDDEKTKEPKHIKDSGGLLSMKKETFNLARVEYTKRPGGEYTIKAKTHFARGEIVEICPVIVLGEEAKTIDKIKDVIFEIDRDKNEWALVLGYGSLYKHADKPNLDYAYNKLTKQMYFITRKTIKHGEELTINYGQDYWMERMTFNTMADVERANSENNQGMPVTAKVVTKEKEDIEESEVQPNAADIKNTDSMKKISSPKNPHNPVRSGVAIIGTGQS
jgi:hypothetical protein